MGVFYAFSVSVSVFVPVAGGFWSWDVKCLSRERGELSYLIICLFIFVFNLVLEKSININIKYQLFNWNNYCHYYLCIIKVL